jgi:peptidoglycan/xylan/chitin deacetylase (PgdA/CDA1 family)
MIRDLAPIIGRRMTFGVVPNWHGQWPLAAHPDYCRLIEKASDELLLHGYFHRRQRGWGPSSLLAERSDEMNGLDPEETRRVVVRGQSDFIDIFGEPARGFLAPAWQAGHVRTGNDSALGLDHIVGFFSLDSRSGTSVPLATWTWDCGRWSWLGHVGHGIGFLLQSLDNRVPTLAIHPRDMHRGYWPRIVRLTKQLVGAGYEPATVSELLAARAC